MPPESNVESVRVSREIASMRTTFPSTGSFSFVRSQRSRPASVRRAARSAKTKPASRITMAHHHCRTNFELSMIAVVYQGSVWFRLVSSSVICGRTTVTSATTTSIANTNMTLG